MSMPPLIKKQTIVLDSLPEDEAELAALKEKLRDDAFLYIKGGTGGGSGNFPIASLTSPCAVQPDGTTTVVDSTGLLSALGGNLLYNSEEWITESGTWIAPVTGWYDVWMIGGGQGALITASAYFIMGGISGNYVHSLLFFEAGSSVPVVIGAAGIGRVSDSDIPQRNGGITSFGELSTEQGADGLQTRSVPTPYYTTAGQAYGAGGGFGGGYYAATDVVHGTFWGAGGGGYINDSGSVRLAGNGYQGAIRLRYYDPAKANGPTAASTFALSRKAARVAKPSVVNLYDPETGQGSVWREEDAPAQLARGLIPQEAWQAICEQKAAEAHAAWLADSDTEAERIEMLRAACEQKLSQTDKFTVPDYPITDEQRQAILAYRQAIRDLNHESGAPWDGGGELTPWPEMPELNPSDETE